MWLARIRSDDDGGSGGDAVVVKVVVAMVVRARGLQSCAPLCTTPLSPLHPPLSPPSPICLRKPRNLFRRATLRFLTFSLLSHERYRIGATCRLRTQITGATGATGTTWPKSRSLTSSRVGLDRAKSHEIARAYVSPRFGCSITSFFGKHFRLRLCNYIICFDYIIISSHSLVWDDRYIILWFHDLFTILVGIAAIFAACH